ncbi:hypothetical protein ES703_118454 [subsurface metagenome]
MWEIERNFKAKIGGNYFINCESLISYQGKPLFTVKRRESDGRLGIDFDVYDKDGHKVATIRRGNVVEGNAKAYEIAHGANQHKVIEKATGRVIVQIDKNPPDADIAVSVNMYLPDGFLLEATPDAINIGSSKMIGNILEGCKTGIAVGD